MSNLKSSQYYKSGEKKYLVFTYTDGTEKCFLVDGESLVEDDLPSNSVLTTSFSLLN